MECFLAAGLLGLAAGFILIFKPPVYVKYLGRRRLFELLGSAAAVNPEQVLDGSLSRRLVEAVVLYDLDLTPLMRHSRADLRATGYCLLARRQKPTEHQVAALLEALVRETDEAAFAHACRAASRWMPEHLPSAHLRLAAQKATPPRAAALLELAAGREK